MTFKLRPQRELDPNTTSSLFCSFFLILCFSLEPENSQAHESHLLHMRTNNYMRQTNKEKSRLWSNELQIQVQHQQDGSCPPEPPEQSPGEGDIVNMFSAITALDNCLLLKHTMLSHDSLALSLLFPCVEQSLEQILLFPQPS